MKKNFILLGTLLVSGLTFAQVGINTPAPQATLDVVGKPTDLSSLDGVIAPRITGAQLRAKTYTGSQEGALVYVTTADPAPAGQTLNVNSIGYFYFDGSLWQTVKSSGTTNGAINIYNANGSIVGSETRRTLTLNGKELSFNGTEQRSYWSANGSMNQSNEQSGTGQASISLYGGNDSNLRFQQFYNSNAQISIGGNSTGLDLSTHKTVVSAPITFRTSAGSNLDSSEKMRITGEGNVGINITNPTEKIDNNGITRLRVLPLNGATNAINTTPGGGTSPTQDQTFTATRTVVADTNGVLGYVTGLPSATPTNIYTANGGLNSARTLTLSGFPLNFTGTEQSTTWASLGGITQRGLAGTKRASIILRSDDNNSDGVTSNMQLFQDPESLAQITTGGDSRGLNIATSQTTQPAPITFVTSSGSNALGTEKMRITGTGNLGIGTTSPTEKLHSNGNVRLQGLPLNGATNAIYTTSTGTASAAQDQTFTATRTVVADNNGVLGYVNTLPSDAGTTKVIVNVSVPGTQNLQNAFSPPVTAQFTTENIDTYNAWTNNVFTVPANLGGLYSVVMQNSSSHTSTGTATPTWSTIAFYEKSTDGGTNWTELMRHTYSNLAGTIVDNGNTLYWTGSLNAGDQLRVRFNCNSTTNNIVNNGGITITKIAQ